MIIRTTFNDNDYTMLLENYWDRFLFDNCYSALENLEGKNDNKNIKLWVSKHKKIENLINKSIYNEKEMTSDEIKEFEDLIKESIISYIDKRYLGSDMYNAEEYFNMLNYLEESLRVDFKEEIKDQCENGEVVYYFLRLQKYLTM